MDQTQGTTPGTQNSEELAEPRTDKPWLWHKGQPSSNPYGRAGNPDKKTMVTEVRRKADRKASRLADALIETALKGNVRAFIAIRDTAYGVPKQSLVIERADDPLTRWIQGMSGIDVVNDLPALPPPEHG